MTDKMVERALYEIAPRYQKSAVIESIYRAVQAVWRREIDSREETLLSCDAFDTMPTWLLEKYCGYFGVDKTRSEGWKRSELNWRLLTLNEMTDLRTMMNALHLDCTLSREGNTMYVYIILQSDQQAQDMDKLAKQVKETLQAYGPAHLCYEVKAATEAGAEITLYCGTAVTYSEHFYVGGAQ